MVQVVFFHKLQHQSHQLLDQENLKTVLSYVEGICSDITVSMANLNDSEQDADVHDELQTILHAFNKPFGENEEVLVISLGVPTVDCPGLLSEEKVCFFLVFFSIQDSHTAVTPTARLTCLVNKVYSQQVCTNEFINLAYC